MAKDTNEEPKTDPIKDAVAAEPPKDDGPKPDPRDEEETKEADGRARLAGPFERLFSTTHGRTRARVLDILGTNTSRQYTCQELGKQIGESSTVVESAVGDLLNLQIIALEGKSLSKGNLGFNSGLLGTSLSAFITEYGRFPKA